MIILDTNVVSESTRVLPNPDALQWVSERPSNQLYMTAITEAELRCGVEFLYPGRRRSSLEAAFERMIGGYFRGRILSLESEGAPVYAEIRAIRRVMGRSVKELDCMIAAIVRVNDAVVATRVTGGFDDYGAEVIIPWTD